MSSVHPEAQALNDTITASSPAVFHMLSQKGRAVYYPKRGLPKQGADAKGKKINATIGIAIEDDGTPMRLDAISRRVELPPEEAFPYASSYGLPELRKQWLKMIREKNPSLKNDTSLPVVTSGLTHGLSTTGYLFVDPGDKIIVSDIFWGNYRLVFETGLDAELIKYNTFTDTGYDISAIEKSLKASTGKRLLILNYPHNPTGYTLSQKEAQRLCEILKADAEAGNSLVVLLDDAYFGLLYEEEGMEKESLFSRIADLHENILAVKIDGCTKEDYVWGFRTGFITYSGKGLSQAAYTALADKTGGAIRSVISNSSILSQSLLLHAFRHPGYAREKQDKFDLLKSRYEEVKNVLAAHPEYNQYFEPLPFNSGYFMCVRLKHGLEAEAVRQHMLSHYDIGVVATFNLIRVAFSAVPQTMIAEVYQSLHAACRDLAGG